MYPTIEKIMNMSSEQLNKMDSNHHFKSQRQSLKNFAKRIDDLREEFSKNQNLKKRLDSTRNNSISAETSESKVVEPVPQEKLQLPEAVLAPKRGWRDDLELKHYM